MSGAISKVFTNKSSVAEIHKGIGDLDLFIAGGNSSSFSFSFQDDDSLKIVSDLTSNAPDTLIDIERVEFFDGYLAFDVDGNAGQAYRLYQAAFDRKPDAEGLGFWIDNYDSGNISLLEISEHFVESEEFSLKYGSSESLSNQSYLTLLYNNVLDRDPDQAGFDFWNDQQNAGVSRAEMLRYFSESVENNMNVAAAIDDGIWYV